MGPPLFPSIRDGNGPRFGWDGMARQGLGKHLETYRPRTVRAGGSKPRGKDNDNSSTVDVTPDSQSPSNSDDAISSSSSAARASPDPVSNASNGTSELSVSGIMSLVENIQGRVKGLQEDGRRWEGMFKEVSAQLCAVMETYERDAKRRQEEDGERRRECDVSSVAGVRVEEEGKETVRLSRVRGRRAQVGFARGKRLRLVGPRKNMTGLGPERGDTKTVALPSVPDPTSSRRGKNEKEEEGKDVRAATEELRWQLRELMGIYERDMKNVQLLQRGAVKSDEEIRALKVLLCALKDGSKLAVACERCERGTWQLGVAPYALETVKLVVILLFCAMSFGFCMTSSFMLDADNLFKGLVHGLTL
ncbi:hypothetical protein BXZ70DRAFT_934466 [Cristinia sonorae]|uniref:Uncharacterized protein n=1 Tax=Cristinia sonorae TaxID=1940300 RepID=A0A8K0UPB2_9AGAR|nr:hypothetical protein BXZ70DRAFT_934466 [Cristinia sonorae]